MIDADYRGEIRCLLYNTGEETDSLAGAEQDLSVDHREDNYAHGRLGR